MILSNYKGIVFYLAIPKYGIRMVSTHGYHNMILLALLTINEKSL
jgi:hypothetical protein